MPRHTHGKHATKVGNKIVRGGSAPGSENAKPTSTFDPELVKSAQKACAEVAEAMNARTMKRTIFINELLRLVRSFPTLFQAVWGDSRHFTFKCVFTVPGREPLTKYTVKAIDGNSDNMMGSGHVKSARAFLLNFVDECEFFFKGK